MAINRTMDIVATLEEMIHQAAYQVEMMNEYGEPAQLDGVLGQMTRASQHLFNAYKELTSTMEATELIEFAYGQARRAVHGSDE